MRVAACFDVMHELRPHLQRQDFVETVKWMQEYDAYRLAYGTDHNSVVVVAGYRLCHYLAWGPTLYVDDLVTAEAHRSKGYGHSMMDWLLQEAAAENCETLQLDSALWRKEAHRFYEREGLEKASYHFGIDIARDSKEEDR